MRLKVKKINFETGNVKVVVLHSKDAEELGGRAGDRVVLKTKEKEICKPLMAILDVSYSDAIVQPGEIGLFIDIFEDLETTEELFIFLADVPNSFQWIKNKIKGKVLTNEQINSIITDAMAGHLTNIELASFITGVSIHGMNHEEMTALALAETRSGQIFNFGAEVFDKHSTGGVPGNKVSLIIVPIVAAAGLLIPKTSTRAITSPSGTADSMEILAPVTFQAEKIEALINKENAFIVWGGAINTSPAENILIDIERLLRNFSRQMMAKNLRCYLKKLQEM